MHSVNELIMLGLKSNRGPIKGVFAEKLREQIAAIRTEPKLEKAKVQTKTSGESKK